ncbi:MAG: tetratricopeptide repeat protein [Phycisphaerales bacterium]
MRRMRYIAGRAGARGARRGGTAGVVLGGVVVVAVGALVAFALVRAVGGGASKAEAGQDASAVAGEKTVERLLESVQTYVRDGETAKAQAILETAVKEHPDDQDLRLAYGQLLMQAGRNEEAFEQYDAASRAGAISAEEHFAAGTLAVSVGRLEDAARHYDLAQRLDAGNARYPLYLAQVQLKLGLKSEAMASLVRASVIDDSNAQVWGSLANIALTENKANLALQHIAKARALEPESRDWRLIESRALKRLGRPEEALATLQALGDSVLADDEALKAMAECDGMLGEPGEALALYERALAARAPTPELLFEAALWAERANEKSRALELARRAGALGHEGGAKMATRLSGG